MNKKKLIWLFIPIFSLISCSSPTISTPLDNQKSQDTQKIASTIAPKDNFDQSDDDNDELVNPNEQKSYLELAGLFKDGKRVKRDYYKFDNPNKDVITYKNNYGNKFEYYYDKKTLPSFLQLESEHKDTKIDPSILADLDKKAKEVGQMLYQNAQKRFYSLPHLDNGKIDGLDINLVATNKKFPGVMVAGQNNVGPDRSGLPRVLANPNYQNLAKRAVSFYYRDGARFNSTSDPASLVKFVNIHEGSATILDYKIEPDGSYPKTWYFITAAHVIANLKIANNYQKDGLWGTLDNFNPNDLQTNTWDLEIIKLNSDVNTDKIISPTLDNPSDYKTVTLTVHDKNGVSNNGLDKQGNYTGLNPVGKMNIRTVLLGTDFFNLDLASISKQKEIQDFGLALDVGIVEITFDSEAQARLITQDFYDGHLANKLDKTDILSDDYYKLPPNPFYSLGFPQFKYESTLKLKDEDKYPKSNKDSDVARTPWINKNRDLYSKIASNQFVDWKSLAGGSDFSTSWGYRNFVNRPGVSDILITAPIFGQQSLDVPYLKDGKIVKKHYLWTGLTTHIDNYVTAPGASGSGVYIGDNLYGIFAGSDSKSSTSVITNLYSSGFDYKGYYGKYNLPAYDVIYGGFADQRKSYLSALRQMHHDDLNFKTALFDKGLNWDYKRK
ncbi:Ig-specific serine endopeptidase MIP [Mesomycoplasma bovoculi]|uniref:Putative lipoprotein n=1 Tax=Mesomycoplasma bovoculi M165/69 TaxID=743966 RepID=W5UT17_9BACT|nr:DUF31 family protein [Mesomycoplasma bovoculi]AHH45271.1 putative lipoprotein [Mesomycoplasma bovoculi M165/69]